MTKSTARKRNPVGRPRTKTARRNRITVSYNDAEWAALQRLANDAALPEFVRRQSLK